MVSYLNTDSKASSISSTVWRDPQLLIAHELWGHLWTELKTMNGLPNTSKMKSMSLVNSLLKLLAEF